MIRKKMLLLSVFLTLIVSALNLNAIGVSAMEYPAIYISPAWVHTDDPASAIGTNYIFSVYTDYIGSDVFGYQFTLTYNSSVIQGVEVVNGDLITEADGPTIWNPGTFNNTEGKLSMPAASFFSVPPAIPPVTSGPGILANVTFTVVGYGSSDVTLGDITRLFGWNAIKKYYNIVDDTIFGHIEGGIFYNRIKGDCNIDRIVNIIDAAYVSAHWYPGPPIGPLGYYLDADTNNDGAVDILDVAMVSAHWGQSY